MTELSQWDRIDEHTYIKENSNIQARDVLKFFTHIYNIHQDSICPGGPRHTFN